MDDKIEFIENPDAQTCVVKSSKMIHDMHIVRAFGGFAGFVFKVEKGVVPNELSGKYSNMVEAKRAATKYLNNKKETVAARRENFRKERAERKLKDGSTARSKDS